MSERIDVAKDMDGIDVVIIHDVKFKGKRKINWKDVEAYLKEYVGTNYTIAKTSEEIYIGGEFPDEYSNSNDTIRLNGTAAKAKANAVQGIPKLIEVAGNKRFQENFKSRHSMDAKNGWYRYTSNFALPVYGESDRIQHYNVFRIEILVRHACDGKLYLYDMVNIKKRNEHPA